MTRAESRSSDIIKCATDFVENHDFHPVTDGFTYDKKLNEQGVADLEDEDWLVRTQALKSFVCASFSGSDDQLIHNLNHRNSHVRQLSASALSIKKTKSSVQKLTEILRKDRSEFVRAQSAISLGQIGDVSTGKALRKAAQSDGSKDVRHQASVAHYFLKQGYEATENLQNAYLTLRPETYKKIEVGDVAEPFILPKASGGDYKLHDNIGNKMIVLIWIFADWCPVCHREFQELFELEEEFKKRDIEVCTLECHDIYPARLMRGLEFEPEYWFSDESFYSGYKEKIWWPHLADPAAKAGLIYGVQPMAFAVHAEFINRPAVIIIDKDGIVRFSYFGTFWGDRPSMKDLLNMADNNEYKFEAENRLTH